MTMKVFNLACEHDHRFEGWFASAAAYDDQIARHLIECPVCSSHAIEKRPAAPRLNLSSPRTGDGAPGARTGAGGQPAPGDPRAGRMTGAHAGPADTAQGRDPSPAGGPDAVDPARAQAMFLQMVRRIMASTEDVGDRFTEEARRIHYSEAPERAIRGSATREQAAELREEGIDVLSLPVPRALKEKLQ